MYLACLNAALGPYTFASVPISCFAGTRKWGHNFRPDYLRLADFARAANAKTRLALTATATPKVGVVLEICRRGGRGAWGGEGGLVQNEAHVLHGVESTAEVE